MTPPTFADLYNQIVEATGETPGFTLHANLREYAERHPAVFAAKTQEVIKAWQAGRIQSPWPFLRAAMRTIDEHRPVTEAEAPDRDRALRLAETWIRNAGLYAPLTEALDETFGTRGHLHPWADDPQLHARITELWHAEQPRQERAEHEKHERAARYRASRKAQTAT